MEWHRTAASHIRTRKSQATQIPAKLCNPSLPSGHLVHGCLSAAQQELPFVRIATNSHIYHRGARTGPSRFRPLDTSRSRSEILIFDISGKILLAIRLHLRFYCVCAAPPTPTTTSIPARHALSSRSWASSQSYGHAQKAQDAVDGIVRQI